MRRVNFTCQGGGSGSFTIPMPDYTVTVGDSQWYPSGDQQSPLVYQGSVTAPDGCGNGGTMHQDKIAVLSADVTSSPSGIKLNYNNASGSWSSTNSVVTSPPVKQTIPGDIFNCVNHVGDGSYTMNATAQPGQQFVACGQSGVNIPTPGTANQTVTVPPGGGR